MMTGSELKFCRSAILSQCNAQSVTNFSKDFARKGKRYKLSMSKIEKAMSAQLWHSTRQVIRYELKIFLTEFAKKTGAQAMNYDQLINRWKLMTVNQGAAKYSGHSLFLRLNSNEHDMVFDFLEIPQVNGFGQALKEHVNFTDEKFPNSTALAKIIVEQSRLINQKAKPNILLVTAGARDTFADIDAYQAFFENLDATVQWLPIDEAINTLHVDQANCSMLDSYREKFLNSYQRQNIYHSKTQLQNEYCKDPSKITAMINQADGLLFIGDSPMRLRDSLIIHSRIESMPLTTIKRRVKQNKLFVAAIGGVSRAMVGNDNNQPLIVSGTSQQVVSMGTERVGANSLDCQGAFSCQRKQTMYSEGGIGLFDFSIVDTHFSSKGRFARLANVAMDTNQKFAVGIDHDTALLVDTNAEITKLKVVGLSGVSVIQRNLAVAPSKIHELEKVNLSYFTTGDILSIDDDKISVVYPEWKPNVPSFFNQLQDYKNLLFGDNFYRFSQQVCLVDTERWVGYGGRKKEVKISLTKSKQTQLKMGGLKVANGFKLYCSFHALELNLTRR